MLTEKARESRVRRALAKAGYRLCKTPSRSWIREAYGPGYMIIENYRNIVVTGCTRHEYSDTLEDVEAWTFKS